MKSQKSWKSILVIIAILFAGSAHAVKPGEDDDKKICKKPKFREFFPEAKAEVLPESEVSFHVSRGAEAHTITAEAKGEKMHVNVTDKISFLIVTTKLPPSVQDDYARIHVTAKAVEGGCIGEDGWLIKVKPATIAADKPAAAQPPKP
jgi:hypothetical protein